MREYYHSWKDSYNRFYLLELGSPLRTLIGGRLAGRNPGFTQKHLQSVAPPGPVMELDAGFGRTSGATQLSPRQTARNGVNSRDRKMDVLLAFLGFHTFQVVAV